MTKECTHTIFLETQEEAADFNPAEYFYYVLKLDYNDQTYIVEDINGNRVGDINPINWYEYVNP